MANLKYKNSNNQWKSLSVARGPKGDNADITLNGTSSNNISIYAPISSGLSGQILQSNGANEKPTWVEHQMPIVNNAVLDIQKNGTSLGTFSANANENKTINIEVPIVENILSRIYPVGSIYLSLNTINPSTFLGGTWELIKDAFLVGAGNSYQLGSTGGSSTHRHTTGDHTLTINEMPKHTHQYDDGIRYWSEGTATGGDIVAETTSTGKLYMHTTTETGGSQAHNHGNTSSVSNIPPYIAVYIWKRTA